MKQIQFQLTGTSIHSKVNYHTDRLNSKNVKNLLHIDLKVIDKIITRAEKAHAAKRKKLSPN